MKSFLILFIFCLLTNLAYSATALEKIYHNDFEALNQQIQHELLYGDLSQKSVQKSLHLKIKKLAPLAKKVGGRKYMLRVVMSFQRTIAALKAMNKNYRVALDMTYANGLTGRDIIIQATNPENGRKLVEIYHQKKDILKYVYSGKELRSRAMDLTLEELNQSQEFDFLKIEPAGNYVLNDPVFSFIADKCVSEYGEEDFFLLVFGFHRCYSKKYRIDRYTIGPGFYSADSGYSYVTGMKIGKKSFRGVGARVKAGIFYGGGIGVFIGNGLMLSLDLERASGAYAGATYFVLKHQ